MPLPPGSSTSSILQTLQWMLDPIDYLNQMKSSYGGIFTARVGWNFSPIVFVSHPKGIQATLSAGQEYIQVDGDSKKFSEPLLGSSSVIVLKGKQHTQRRKLLKPPFHSSNLSACGQNICNITNHFINQQPVGIQFLASSLMQDITLRIILQIVFGISEDRRLQKVENLLKAQLSLLELPIAASWLLFPILQQDWGQWSPWGYFRHLQQQTDDLLYQQIAEFRKTDTRSRHDILSLMMSARDDRGEGLTDKELRDNLLSLLFAGHESTAISMAVALYWIHSIPDVREKLIAELDGLGDRRDPMEIAQLPYLSAVCQETLRIAPVTPTTSIRSVVQKFDIMGYELEPGTKVTCCIYLTHHREDLYPEPHQFKPERFLERKFSQYEYLPFGGGNRRCIGESLAMLEMKLVLGTLLSRYRLELCDYLPLKIQRRGFLLAPASGVKMRLLGRR